MTKRPVVTIGHALSISDPPDETQVGSNILFVGSAWVPNVDGIRQFAENVFPKVRQRVPAATLQVVGSVGSHVPKTDRCVCLGRVDDLAPVYRNAAVVINPVREGTGLAIKSVEALAWGRPLVTYASGARGFGEAVGAAVRVVDSEEDFAAEVCRLLSDVNERASRAQAAHTFAVAWNERITLQLEATLTQHVAHAGLSRQTV